MSAGLLLALASMAQANTISSNQPDCTGSTMTQRVFSVTATTVIKCLAKGDGNINGNGDAINSLGYTLLDKSDDAISGALQGTLSGSPSLTSGLSGSFAIASSVFSLYDNIVIAFKSGDGQIDPTWAAFLLADNTLTGTWAITGAQQALSHANLYGKLKSGGPTPGGGVSEPASIALFGLALLGMSAARRRRS